MNRRDFLGLSVLACGSVLFSNPVYSMIEENSSFFNAEWIGHSTVLMRFGSNTIITDPVLFSRIGLYVLGNTLGMPRYTQPAIKPENLPTINLVLLSHAHIDHMCLESLEWITEQNPYGVSCITASNTKDIIQHLKWKSLYELDWEETYNFNGINIKGHEVLHNGWRLPGEKCRRDGYKKLGRSYNGYTLEKNGLKVLFGGDTAYTKTFSQINADIAIMPIGAYQGFSDNHCTPEAAIDMTSMTNAKIFMPIHFGTFIQSEEPRWEPVQRLLHYTKNIDIDIVGTKVGYRFTL